MGCSRGSGDPFFLILGFLGFFGGYFGGPPQKKFKSENTKWSKYIYYKKSEKISILALTVFAQLQKP